MGAGRTSAAALAPGFGPKSQAENVSLGHVQLFAAPRTLALQAPLSMGFSMLFITCLSRHKFANNLRSKSCKLIGIQKIFSLCVYKHMYTHRTSEGKYKQSVVQSLSHVQLFTAPWTATCHVPLSSTISWNLLKFMSGEVVMLSNHTCGAR